MLINFDGMEEKAMPEFKGGIGDTIAKMYFDGDVRVLKGHLPKGASIGMHEHIGNCETIYIFSGQGKVLYDDTEEILSAGSVHFCPEGHKHSLINTGDEPLEFLGVIPQMK